MNSEGFMWFITFTAEPKWKQKVTITDILDAGVHFNYKLYFSVFQLSHSNTWLKIWSKNRNDNFSYPTVTDPVHMII